MKDLPAIFMLVVTCMAASCTRVETAHHAVEQQTFEPDQFADRGEVTDEEQFEYPEPPPKSSPVNSYVFQGHPELKHDNWTGVYSLEPSNHQGLTLRDYLAAHAPPKPTHLGGPMPDAADEAKWRWEYADEMLRQR